MKFRKRPVIIEAVQWTRSKASKRAVLGFIGECPHSVSGDSSELIIRTLEGNHLAVEGDWIIKGIKGEFYPCKPDIFAQTYEAIEEAT